MSKQQPIPLEIVNGKLVPVTQKKPAASVTQTPVKPLTPSPAPAAPPKPVVSASNSVTPAPTPQLTLPSNPKHKHYVSPQTYKHFQEFRDYHRSRPEVYDLIVAECRRAKEVGLKKVGIAFIWERLRYIYSIKRRMGDEFKLNNNLKGLYARVVMFNNPDLDDFITIRDLTSQ